MTRPVCTSYHSPNIGLRGFESAGPIHATTASTQYPMNKADAIHTASETMRKRIALFAPVAQGTDTESTSRISQFMPSNSAFHDTIKATQCLSQY